MPLRSVQTSLPQLPSLCAHACDRRTPEVKAKRRESFEHGSQPLVRALYRPLQQSRSRVGMMNNEIATPEQLVRLGERERQRQAPQRFFGGRSHDGWPVLNVSDDESGGFRGPDSRQGSHGFPGSALVPRLHLFSDQLFITGTGGAKNGQGGARRIHVQEAKSLSNLRRDRSGAITHQRNELPCAGSFGLAVQ